MLRLLSGYWFSQALYVAAALGIADRIADGPRSADEIAAAVGADAETLYRLLRALSSVGVFEMVPRGFELTPLSETLLSQREQSLRPVALLGGHPLHWGAWGRLLDSVKTGKTGFELAHGEAFFDALGRDVVLMREFHRIATLSTAQCQEIIAAIGLHRFTCVVDIGGGTGALAQRMAEAYPNLRVVLFDRPEVLNLVSPHALVEDAPGNFFEQVPEIGDAYLLKFVLHNWNDADATRILSCCRRHIPRNARMFIIEVLAPQDGTSSIAMTHDVNMLVLTGGRERSLEQYRTLLGAAGFELDRFATTGFGVSVLEAARDDAA